jgi:hypothetical protein
LNIFLSVLKCTDNVARVSTRTWRQKKHQWFGQVKERALIEDIQEELQPETTLPGVCHCHRGARCRRTHRTCSSTGGIRVAVLPQPDVLWPAGSVVGEPMKLFW